MFHLDLVYMFHLAKKSQYHPFVEPKTSPKGMGNSIMDLQDWKIISTYTRAEAVNDGVQIAIPQEISREAGINYLMLIRDYRGKGVKAPLLKLF